MSRRVCVVTGSRSEYGLLRWLLEEIRSTQELELQIVATGMHLSPEFGLTYREIEKDGFVIDRRVETLVSSDTAVGISKSMGLGLIGFGEALQQLRPQLVVVLGDRFEIFAAVAAALVGRIPVAHLHGGELTEGAFDDAMRHSITKMSHLHFVAAEPYRARVIQLGEDPERVFTVGGLGLDNLKKLTLLERADLERALDFSLGAKSLLITFHPVTLGTEASCTQLGQLLKALDALPDTQLIFTMPNADTEGRAMTSMITRFVDSHANARAYSSLGQQLYLSCIAQVDAVVGNSSSGLIEAPSLRKGTVNIGDRQRGRLKARSIIDCDAQQSSIAAAIREVYSSEFQSQLGSVRNPYGEPGAAVKIARVLRDCPLETLLRKSFHDLPAGVQ